MSTTDEPLLDVDRLSVTFRTRHGQVYAVREVSLALAPGETLAVLGESGSGKSVTALSIMGLLGAAAATTTGAVRYRGTDLLTMPKKRWRDYRGTRIAMIFQDSLAALNPVQSVGTQITELITAHSDRSRSQARRRAVEMMDRVRIPAAAQRYDNYPHQFSGGMRQRIMIAMALALDPAVLIADEPTTALDVTVQAKIMQLLIELQADNGMALMLITHDLGVSAEVADRIAVMYAGRIVETGPAAQMYSHPRHPYTIGLLNSIPRAAQKGRRLQPIVGSPPPLNLLLPGCSFHPRCPYGLASCLTVRPPLDPVGDGRLAACLRAEDIDHVVVG